MASRLTLREFFTHSSLTLVQQGLGATCALGISIILARVLGPSGQGQYGLVISTAVIASALSSVGIPSASVYYVGSQHTPVAKAVQQNALMALFFGALGGTCLLLAAPWILPGVPASATMLGSFLVLALLFNNFMTSVLQGAQDFRTYNIAALAPPLLTMLLLAAGVLAGGKHLPSALAAALLAQGVTALGTFLALHRRGLHGPWRLDPAYLRRALTYGGMATLANTVGFLNYRADAYLINRWMDATAVGHYTIAVGVTERLWILSFAASVVLLPHTARSEADGAPSLTPLVARHMLWLSVLGGACLFAIAPWVLPLVFGDAYVPSVPALRALVPGVAVLNVARVLGNDLAGRGRPGMNAALGAVALAINLAANAWCIPRFGIVGAGWATSLSYSCDALMKLAAFCSISGVPWRDVLLLKRADWQRLRKRATPVV